MDTGIVKDKNGVFIYTMVPGPMKKKKKVKYPAILSIYNRHYRCHYYLALVSPEVF